MESHDLLHFSTSALQSLCRQFGLPKGPRLEMIRQIETQVVGNSRKRKRGERNESNYNSTKNKKRGKTPIIQSTKRIKVSNPEYFAERKRHEERVGAAVRIQRWWKKHGWSYTNSTDFITLDPITVPPFRLVENDKNIFKFHPLNLATYFLKEGKFINPYTRRPLYNVELMRLDRYVKLYNTTFVSLFKEKQRLEVLRAQEREHEQTCHMLHNESLRILSDVILLTQDEVVHLPGVLFELTNVVIPRYFHTFRQLYLLDYSFACDSILYVCNTLSKMWRDPNVNNSRERSQVIETTEYSLTQFCKQLLPVFGMILPEFVGSNALQDVGPVR